ncbi:MAG: HAD-IA family hydrolase [Actinomycetota bacterium]|nr:HAD-IA family hydrolase [Actinomycetota bacterium]
MSLRAVFFDAGETLLYPHPSFTELFAEVLRENGHPIDPAEVQHMVSVSSDRFNEIMRSDDAVNWSTTPEKSRTLWDGVYRMFLSMIGIPEDDHERLVKALYARFSDLASYRLHPDAMPVLERLRKTDLKLGLISNFEDWLEQLLEILEVGHFFDITVISGVEGVEKPDPRIFQVALDRAGVSAGEAAYVGDNPVFDAEPARELGMTAVLIDRRGRHPDVDVPRITSLEDLPAVLDLRA